MKKIYIALLACIVCSLSWNGLNAQCTVHPHTQAGFYPLSADGIHPAAATAPYALNITVVIPPDTIIAPFPSLTIDSAKVQSFIGFPAGFQYQSLPASGWIKGGQSGCILVSGTPANGDVGIHSISFVFTAMIMGFAYTDTINDYWQFEIKDSSHIGIQDNMDDGATELFPNPAGDQVRFISKTTGLTLVEIYSLSGIRMVSHEVSATLGEELTFQTGELSSGLYSVAIHTAAGTTLRKLAIIR
jgi:hypothetical protein